VERFRKAGNHSSAPPGPFQDRQKELEENLQKKAALCVQAEEICTRRNGRRGEGHQALQAQWKGSSVPATTPMDLQRFRKANDQFFEHRQVHYEQVDKENKENIRKKRSSAGKPRTLHSTSFKETARP